MSRRKATRLPRREPSGRPSRAEAVDPAISPTAAKRLLNEAARDVSRAEFGTEIGRLFMAGKLSPAQYTAARHWNNLLVDWYHAIGAPFPYEAPGPIAALGTGRGASVSEDPPVDSKAGRRMLEARRRIMDRMLQAEAVLDQGGPFVKLVVRSVCERDATLAGHDELLQLRDGLTRLVRHWRLSQ
jgi:hypothetical protein